MRIAVFSDNHGNPFATEAVIGAIQAAGSFDAIVAAGDLCLGGSDPAACVECLLEAGVQAVYGNTETYLYAPEQEPVDELHLVKWHTIQPAAYWVLEQLDAHQAQWLRNLPFELRFSPTGYPADDLLVVHANPQNVELMILPALAEQRMLWKEIRQPDDDQELLEALAGEQAGTIAFGHFHYTSLRSLLNYTLVNVAPCSLPGIDHDPRARFTVFNWEGGRWKIERHWVRYDHQREIEALQASEMPYKEAYLRYFR